MNNGKWFYSGSVVTKLRSWGIQRILDVIDLIRAQICFLLVESIQTIQNNENNIFLMHLRFGLNIKNALFINVLKHRFINT